MLYAGASKSEPFIPLDGSHISTSVVILLPTSRGSITLASTNPTAIDPNYYATEADRHVMHTGLKKVMQVLLDTPEGQAMVLGETVAEGHTAFSPNSNDEALDAYVRRVGQ